MNTVLILALKQIRGVGNISILRAFKGIPLSKINDSFNFIKSLPIRSLQYKIKNHTFSQSNWKALLNYAQNEIKQANQLHIYVISFLSSKYPRNLKTVSTHKFPVILYVKGNVDILNQKSVAIVGTRQLSKFGTALAQRFAKYFVQQGYITVAGLAYGTDCVAQQATIDAGGKTVAIMANGLDQPVYPKPNTPLARQILKTGGALVSEYPLGTGLMGRQFVQRDKWQSGMSDGTIAVETDRKGGTIHTMRFTRRQGRPLGVPNYAKYFHADPLSLPNDSYGTQEAISKKKAHPLYTRKSVYKFTQLMADDRKKRLSDA